MPGGSTFENDDWQDEGLPDFGDDDDIYKPCPHCGETMLEDAEYCPSCDRWMTDEDMPARRQPLWIIVGAVAALVFVIITVFRF